jgi:hypothetical protein
MSRYSEEERARVMNEVRATLQRGEAEQDQPSMSALDLQDEDELAEALSQPIESRNDRDRREIEAQEREFRRQRRASAIAAQSREARFVATVEQRLQAMRSEINDLRADLQSIAAACNHAVEQIGGALEDLSATAQAPAKAADERMEALFSRLERKLDEIVPRRSGDVLEMPLRGVN